MMSRTRALTAFVVAAAAGVLSALPGQAAGTNTAIHRAIDRLHVELTADLDIWTDHSTMSNPWIARTDHFEVRTTSSYGMARDIAAGLETMLGHFQRVLGTDYSPPRPLPVYILPTRAEYNTFGDDHGEAHSSFYGSFYAAPHPDRVVAAEWNDNLTLLRMHVTHSVVHQYLAAAYPSTAGNRPVWIEEGLAAYFTYYWDTAWTLDQFLALKEAGRLVPMQRLLNANLNQFATSAATRLIQLAILFDYLLRLREDTRSTLDERGRMRGAFRDYLVAVLEGRDTSNEPFRAILDDPAALGREFEAYEFR